MSLTPWLFFIIHVNRFTPHGMYLQRDANIRRLVHPNENAKLRANARIEEKQGASVRQEYEAHRFRELSGP